MGTTSDNFGLGKWSHGLEPALACSSWTSLARFGSSLLFQCHGKRGLMGTHLQLHSHHFSHHGSRENHQVPGETSALSIVSAISVLTTATHTYIYIDYIDFDFGWPKQYFWRSTPSVSRVSTKATGRRTIAKFRRPSTSMASWHSIVFLVTFLRMTPRNNVRTDRKEDFCRWSFHHGVLFNVPVRKNMGYHLENRYQRE